MALPYGKPQDVALLAGVFTAWLTKAVLALGLGEMRHAQSRQRMQVQYCFQPSCIGQDLWKYMVRHICLVQEEITTLLWVN